jgi:hypothetical protein
MKITMGISHLRKPNFNGCNLSYDFKLFSKIERKMFLSGLENNRWDDNDTVGVNASSSVGSV